MIRVLALVAQLVERVLHWVIAAIVAILLLLVTLQLVDRHFVSIGIDAPDQLVRIGVIWLCFLGFAAAVAASANIRIEFLDHYLPPRMRRALAVVFDLAMLALCALLVVKGWRVVEVGAGQLLLGTPFTAAVPNAGFVVGIGLTAFFVLVRLVQAIAATARPAEG